MLSRRHLLLGAAAAAVLPRPVRAQGAATCGAIDLGVPPVAQQTGVWCWAAVAEQIIRWKRGHSPPQCALVALAYGQVVAPCCGGLPQCQVTGSLQQIQYLISQFGGGSTTLAPPTTPDVLHATLAVRRPIIMAVRASPYSQHMVVIRGMRCGPGGPELLINDPMGWAPLTQPVPFAALLPHWQAAIVVS
jgi:hypothetical protein